MKANIPQLRYVDGKPTLEHATLAEKIMWFADAVLNGSQIKPIKERFDDLERGWDGKTESPERAQRNRTFSYSYRSKYEGKSLYHVQRELGEKYTVEFAEAMGIPPEEIYSWLATKVQERIDTHTLPLL